MTVPYGTEATCYQKYMDALVLGPGNIDQAHTVGEWIAVEQLQEAVEVYTRLIEDLCFEPSASASSAPDGTVQIVHNPAALVRLDAVLVDDPLQRPNYRSAPRCNPHRCVIGRTRRRTAPHPASGETTIAQPAATSIANLSIIMRFIFPSSLFVVT